MPDQDWPGLDDFIAQAPAQVAAEPARDTALDEAWPGMSEFVVASTPEGRVNRGLAQARYQASGQELTTAGRIGEHIPFVSGSHIFRAQQYSEAMGRIRAGNPDSRDYQTVAEHERYQQLRGQLSIPEQASSAVFPLLGETMLSGGISSSLAGAATPALAGAAPSIAGRVAGFAGRTLATQATTPTMWNVPQGIEQNVAAGRDTFDLQGLAPAAALGTLQTAILGSLGPVTNSIAGSGVSRALTRTAVGTGVGMVEQQAADVASSTVGQFVFGQRRGEGLNTGYGLAGSVLRGEDDSFRNAMVQALTFAAFSGVHQAQRPVELRDRLYDATRSLGGRGLSRSEAGAILGDVHARFERAVTGNLDQTETRALFESLPEGPVRTYADALADTRPETIQRPQAPTQAEEPAPTEQYGPERPPKAPPVAPTQETAQVPAEQPQTAPAGQPARPVPEPIANAFRERFPNAEASTSRDGVLRAERDGRWVEMAHDPERNVVRLDYGWLKEKAGVGKDLEKGSIRLLKDMGDVVAKLKETGTGVEYVAIGGRERAYERMLKKAGYEQTGGPTGEGGELRTWAPKAEAKPVDPAREADIARLVKLGFKREQAESLADLGRPLQPAPVLAEPSALVQEIMKAGFSRESAEVVAAKQEAKTAPAAPRPSLQERMRQQAGPSTPGSSQAALQAPRQPVAPPAPRTPMQEARQRFNAGDGIGLRETFKAAGLDAREMHVITERLLGRVHEQIAGDQPLLKQGGGALTRQMISVIEKAAMKKLGLEGHTVDSLILASQRAEGAAEMAANGQRVNVGELGVDPRVVQAVKDRLIGRDRALESKVDKLIEAYEEEVKRGELTPDRTAYYVAEHTRLARQLEGKPANAPTEPTGQPTGPVNEPAPVRDAADRGIPEGAEVPPPVPPGQGDARPAQGDAQAPPAPAGRGPAAQGLSRGEVLRRQQHIPKKWAAEAESEGIPADHIHRSFTDHLAYDQAGVRLQNELFDGIKKAIVEQGTTMAAMHRDLASGRADAIKGLDDVVTRLDGPSMGLLRRMMEEHNLDSAEAAREVLEAGRREPRSQDHLYADALDELIGRREFDKELDRANTKLREAQEAPITPDAVEEARRQAEQGEGAQAEDIPPGQGHEGAQGDAHEGTEGGDPGEFEFGFSTRVPSEPNQRGNPEPGPAELPGGPTVQPGAEQRTAGVPDERAGFGSPVTEQERSRFGIGGGQENAGSPTERPKSVTALANEMVDKERAANKLPELMKAARLENSKVWDEAMAKLDKDPQIGARLVEELVKNPRATTVQENALLLQRKIALSNEHTRTMIEFSKGFRDKTLDAAALDALDARERHLFSQIDQLDQVTRSTGTEWGRAGQFRRQLAAEDFTLSSMMMRAEAAKGRPLTEQEKAQLVDLNQRITDLQTKLAAAEKALTEQGKGIASPAFPEMQEALIDSKKAQGEFNRQLESDRLSRRSLGQKFEDLLVKWRRASVISSPITMGKIIAASAERLAFTPIEEGIGAILSRIPGLSKIAAVAPREGRGLRVATEQRAMMDGLTKGMKDAWDTAPWRAGHSELDVMFGKAADMPRSWLDWVGELHAAGKAPAVRAEYTRSFLQRVDAEIAQGRDPTSPAAILEIGAAAYRDAQRAKFQQDNRVVDAWKRAISTLTAPDASAGARAIGTGMKLAVPIIRVPTNLVAEAFQYAFGTVTGSIRAAAVFKRGIETLKPAEADLIMRSLKKGSIGLAVLALGYFNPRMFGGFYSGRRSDEDTPAGGIRTPMGTVPSWLLHNPLLEVLQFGATIRRAADDVRHGGQQGLMGGLTQGILGLAEHVPFVRETADVGRAMNPRQRGAFFGTFARSLAVPQFFQWMAGATDQDLKGEPKQRNPQSVWQHVKMGIPGLRSQVPAR